MPEGHLIHEKRTHPRVPLKIPVTYRVISEDQEYKSVQDRKNYEQAGTTIDVSMGGLYLAANQTFGSGTILRLEVTLPEVPHQFSAYAVVAWSNKTGAGLHFEAIREPDEKILKEYLEQALPIKKEEQKRA
jgi:Tfp pilus assembly protein PilZ